ncbi:MAG: response regulator transcription factor [Chromatiales bacterium]|nr:response regulator transcription factor [Chromatiales bacterium]
MAELSLRPAVEEKKEFSEEGESRAQPNKKGSSNDVIPMTKIVMCSADSAIAERWSDSIDGLGRMSSVSDPNALLSVLDKTHNDIVLFDLELITGSDYREIPERFCKKYPGASFIFFAEQPSEEEGLYLVSKGGMGYCNRYISHELLTKAVEVVRMGEVWLGRKLLFKLMDSVARLNSAIHAESDRHPAENKLADLTEREREIALLVGEGASNKVIAQKLDITERTVKAHLSSIFRKTGSKDRLQLGLLINVKRH